MEEQIGNKDFSKIILLGSALRNAESKYNILNWIALVEERSAAKQTVLFRQRSLDRTP